MEFFQVSNNFHDHSQIIRVERSRQRQNEEWRLESKSDDLIKRENELLEERRRLFDEDCNRIRSSLLKRKLAPIDCVNLCCLDSTIEMLLGKKGIPNVLFYGPTGTGKTTMARQLLSAKELPYVEIMCASVANVDYDRFFLAVFDVVNEKYPCAIYIDQMDAIMGIPRLKEEFLKQTVQGEVSCLLASSNCPWELDNAVINRFPDIVYVPLPNSDCRADFLLKHLPAYNPSLSNEDFIRAVELTEGFSFSGLSDVLKNIVNLKTTVLKQQTHFRLITTPSGYVDERTFLRLPNPVQRYVPCHSKEDEGTQQLTDDVKLTEAYVPLSMVLLEKAITQVKSRCNPAEIAKFESFTEALCSTRQVFRGYTPSRTAYSSSSSSSSSPSVYF